MRTLSHHGVAIAVSKKALQYLIFVALPARLMTGLHFDFRHTGNTFASSGGAAIKDLMARMGHDSERAALICQNTKRAAQTRSSPTASTLTSKPSRAGGTMTTARPVRRCQRAKAR